MGDQFAKPAQANDAKSVRLTARTTPPSSASAPDRIFHDAKILRKSSCPCGGGCPACESKGNLNISHPNDPAEIEADRTADKVMRMSIEDTSPTTKAHPSNAIQRKARDKSASVMPAPAIFGSSDRGLDPAAREFFEPRFGRDLGHVRVHTTGDAAQTAENISARAFTLGDHIGFASNHYDPGSQEGRRLIAHEIAHVVQQDDHGLPNKIHRDFTPWPGQQGRDFADSKGQSTFSRDGDVVREFVIRDDSPGSPVTMPILIEFDKRACSVTSTMDVNFVNDADPKKAVSGEEFQQTKERFFKIANDKLNGWVEIEVGSNDKCKICAGKTMPVKIVAKEGTGEYASRVTVSKQGRIVGEPHRADSGNLMPKNEDSTLWHEAGHIVLGAADEYQEKNPKLAKRPEDKVNPGDNSAMDDHFLPHSVLHARHFSHIAAWLGRKFPDCTFTTKELYVFTGADFRIPLPGIPPLALGYANIGGASGFFAGAGYDLGIPLTNIGDWEMFIGAHATFLMQFEGDQRLAFLAGARIGIEKMWSPREGGLNLGGFVEGGGAFVSDIDSEFVPGAYGYGGLNLGYKYPWRFYNLSFNAEVGGGATSTLQLHDIEKLTKDEKLLPFFTAGVRAGWMF